MHVRVTEERKIRLVDLNVTAAFLVERLDLLAINLGQVCKKLRHIGIRFRVHAGPTAPKMQQGGRWYYLLGDETRRLSDWSQILEFMKCK